MRRTLFVVLGFLVAILATGCGDDGSDPAGPGDSSAPDEAAAVAFLTTTLPDLYDTLDAAGYSAVLHPDFRFVFLDGQAPDEHPAGFWGKTTETAVMSALFGAPDVDRAVLSVSVLESVMKRVPGTDGAWSFRATTLTEVGFLTTAHDTVGATSYYAFTKMDYELRADAGRGGAWTLYEQAERPPIFPPLFKDAAIEGSWGEIKKLFYEPIAAPATRTVKGELHVDTLGTAAVGAVIVVGADSAVTDLFGRFEIPFAGGGETSAEIGGSGFLRSSVPIGGGDDVYRIDATIEPFPFQETPDEFLAAFAEAYSERDSARYALHLDSRYRFELKQNDPDPQTPAPWWDRADELAIAGRMFDGRVNAEGQYVQSIDLGLAPLGARRDTLSTDIPPGEEWYLVEARVHLVVTVVDPADSEGIVHFTIQGDQLFAVRPDPANAGRYLVVRQVDRTGDGKSALPAGTDETTWGSVKGLWR